MIWFTSDWHLNHANIAGPNISKWPKGYRDFSSVKEMNETIITNVNKLVKHDDTLFFLGDLCFKDHSLTPMWRDRIACREFHFIKGNHDAHIKLYKDKFSSVQDYWEGQLGAHYFVLCHYAFRVWHKNSKGAIHCYGHSHSNLEGTPYGKSIDVGVDNARRLLGEYRPFSITEITDIMKMRDTLAVDHHKTV